MTDQTGNQPIYLYERKDSLITATEKQYLDAIKTVLPAGVFIQAQVNLASIIYKTDNSKYQNELFRNIDACIFDQAYKPLVLIEINDSSHNDARRKERDRKVRDICEEAGIPLITFWTSYGVNMDYIKERVLKGIEQAGNPVRIAHHAMPSQPEPSSPPADAAARPSKKGCYIATAVYGSYDCPEVWTLRRYRDSALSASWYGRGFIRLYYAVSPLLVKWFGQKTWFCTFWKSRLDRMVRRLRSRGMEDIPYSDQDY